MMWPFRSYEKFADMDFRTDVHSHILPGVDDGFRTGQDSVKALGLLHDMGVEHCILTPHVYPELYPANNPSSIRNRFSEVSDMLVRTGVECRVAGEHMVYAGVDSGFSEENAGSASGTDRSAQADEPAGGEEQTPRKEHQPRVRSIPRGGGSVCLAGVHGVFKPSVGSCQQV